jgi:hypothetical protein
MHLDPLNSCPYSPECVEVEFCEVRLDGGSKKFALPRSTTVRVLWPPASSPDNTSDKYCGSPVGQAYRTGPMWLLRSGMRGSHILCEVCSLFPKKVRKTRICRRKAPTSSKIVANLSPIGKDVVLHAHLWCAGEKGKPVVRRGRKT